MNSAQNGISLYELAAGRGQSLIAEPQQNEIPVQITGKLDVGGVWHYAWEELFHQGGSAWSVKPSGRKGTTSPVLAPAFEMGNASDVANGSKVWLREGIMHPTEGRHYLFDKTLSAVGTVTVDIVTAICPTGMGLLGGDNAWTGDNDYSGLSDFGGDVAMTGTVTPPAPGGDLQDYSPTGW